MHPHVPDRHRPPHHANVTAGWHHQHDLPPAHHGLPRGPFDTSHLVAQGLRLEYLTVSWNVVEGVIAVAAALAASSVALLGFGIASFIETLSGAILI